jgi:signal transduction histidine kinase
MSLYSARVPGRRRRTWAILLIGFWLIGCVFVAEGFVTTYLTSSTERHSRRLEHDALLSMDDLNQVARDTTQVEALVNEHIYETDLAAMAGVEKTIAARLADIDRTSREFAPLIDQPEEASAWERARAALARIRPSVDRALELSRENKDVEARALWKALRADYSDLGPTLDTLIAINRNEVLEAGAEIEAAERLTRTANMAVGLIGLVAVALLAQWLIRQVLSYERQLEQSADQLATRNHDLDAFAGRVAHDLKNALGPIVLAPDLLRREATHPDRVQRIAERTRRCAERTTEIVDSLLAFARASQAVPPDAAAAVRPAIESVVEDTARLASQVRASVHVAPVPDLVVRCEPGLLHIVLANLVGNSIKYLEGQTERRVQISARRDAGECLLEVADTGPGIPKEQQQKIFQPFYRVHASPAAGTGIGLATVRRIVDARGGRIAVESEECHGARFLVWLPLAPPERAHPDGPNDNETWPREQLVQDC